MMKPSAARVPTDLRANRLSRVRAGLAEIAFDLTVSNPRSCSIPAAPNLLDPLAHPRGLAYQPQPRGPLETRQAVAANHGRPGSPVDPEQIVLTASTSEAYSFLFKALAEPGASVFFPTPSYPLFDSLARLDGIGVLNYSLDPEADWRMDFSAFANAPAATRAVVVVHPNNPSGSYLHPDDAGRLVELCAHKSWALIADEVFFTYDLRVNQAAEKSFAGTADCLCFALGGLSKSVGLPQLKLAWIIASGPRTELAEAMDRIDYVADTYLSVSTPVALAAPEIVANAEPMHRAIVDRCRLNLGSLRELCDSAPTVTLLGPAGGWSAVLRIPTVVDEEELVISLLRDHGVAVHPGFFFDFTTDGHLVLSLLPEPGIFDEGLRRTLQVVVASCR